MLHSPTMTELAYLKPIKTERLLIQVMEALSGDDSFISLEGFSMENGFQYLSLLSAEFPVIKFIYVTLSTG
ncbi:MAG: hypothetical protein ACXV2C_06485 [Candidatus Bathyarchaeia archaeon]